MVMKGGDIILEKVRVRVIIQTTSQLLYGFLHLRKNLRVKDELNYGEERFIAVTDVYFPDAPTPKLNYVVLNKDEIVWASGYEKSDEEHVEQPAG